MTSPSSDPSLPLRVAAFNAWRTERPAERFRLAKVGAVVHPSSLEATAEAMRASAIPWINDAAARRRLAALIEEPDLASIVADGPVRTASAILKESQFPAASDVLGAIAVAAYWGGRPSVAVVGGRVALSIGGHEILFGMPSLETLTGLYTLPALEPGTLSWLSTLGPDDVLLDVGANIGVYALVAAVGRGARVFAIEPSPVNAAALRANIALNPGTRVNVHETAVSDCPGEGLLTATSDAPGATGVVYPAGRIAGGVTVRMDTVDRLVAAGAMPSPTHVKIDIDGGEVSAVRGMDRCLADRRLRSLIVETRTPDRRAALEADLGRHGFTGHRSDSAKNLVFVR